MPKELISIDDLLASQSALLVTVQSLPSDDDRVKVTPFIAGSGCACALAITLSKTAIADLTTTDEVYNCCGERLQVVEIAFTDTTVADIFRQLGEAAAKSAPIPPWLPPLYGRRRRRPGIRRDLGLREDPGENPDFSLDPETVRRCQETYENCLVSCLAIEDFDARQRCYDDCNYRRRRCLGY